MQKHIKITSNYSKINIEKNREKQNNNFAVNTHRIYTTLYHTYMLLQCKEHIQITCIHSTINVETKKVNEMKTLSSIHIDSYHII